MFSWPVQAVNNVQSSSRILFSSGYAVYVSLLHLPAINESSVGTGTVDVGEVDH